MNNDLKIIYSLQLPLGGAAMKIKMWQKVPIF